MYKVLLYIPVYRSCAIARAKWHLQKDKGFELDLYVMDWTPYPGENAYKNLDEKNELARRIAIIGWYDYLWIVEDDIVLPCNALSRLLEVNADCVVGLYRGRPEHWGTDRLSVRIADPNGPQDADDRPLELKDIPADNPVVRCTGIALGCTLLHRKLFNMLEGVIGRDYEVSKRFQENGVSMLCHTWVRCGHIDKKGEIIEV